VSFSDGKIIGEFTPPNKAIRFLRRAGLQGRRRQLSTQVRMTEKNALRQSPAFQNNKAHCVSSAANRCFDLTQCLGTIPRGDRQELLTLGAAAVYLVKPTCRVAGSADHGRARKNIVDERSGLAAVKQAGAPVSSQTDNHSSSLY